MTATADAPVKKVNPNAPTEETVLSVHHYTDRLFKFTITRPSSFRFRSGEFIMIGLMGEKKPLLRAYSVASPNWDDTLEFYSIKVPDGPLTSKLQKIQVGDKVLLGKKPVGTLVHDALVPGKRLYCFSTGTGFAPFASILRDPETYEKFEEVIITHTCRSGKLFEDLDVPRLDPAVDRAMICGSIEMTKELKGLMEEHGLKEGSNAEPADFVIERAFVG